jgi:geranylgeranyl transferase type-2 subunit alpha
MHGRPRQKAGPPEPERVKAAQQKVGQRAAQQPAYERRRSPRRHRPRSRAAACLPHTLARLQAALFGQLSKEVLDRRAAARYDPESLALSAKLLELHPEVYTVWNYRREAVQPVRACLLCCRHRRCWLA